MRDMRTKPLELERAPWTKDMMPSNLRVGEWIAIEGIVFRVERVKPHSGKLNLQAVGRVNDDKGNQRREASTEVGEDQAG